MTECTAQGVVDNWNAKTSRWLLHFNLNLQLPSQAINVENILWGSSEGIHLSEKIFNLTVTSKLKETRSQCIHSDMAEKGRGFASLVPVALFKQRFSLKAEHGLDNSYSVRVARVYGWGMGLIAFSCLKRCDTSP